MKPKQLEKTGLITIRIIATFMIVIFSGCTHGDYQPFEPWNIMPVSATKYFPHSFHSLGSLWVYEDQDGNTLIRRAVEGEEINGKKYHAFSYKPELADKTAYSPFVYPALYHDSNTGMNLLVGDEVEASIKAQLTKEIEVLTGWPLVGDPEVDLGIKINVQGRDHLIMLPAHLVVGEAWEVNRVEVKIEFADDMALDTIGFTITETGFVLDTDTVQTPNTRRHV